MLTSEPGFSAFIPTSHSNQDLPSLGDDEQLWEMFLKLVLEHKAKLTEHLSDALNTSLLFVSSSPFTLPRILRLNFFPGGSFSLL